MGANASGIRYAAHAVRNTITAHAAMPGAASGKMMRRSMTNVPAPSIRAAFSMSAGSAAM